MQIPSMSEVGLRFPSARLTRLLLLTMSLKLATRDQEREFLEKCTLVIHSAARAGPALQALADFAESNRTVENPPA